MTRLQGVIQRGTTIRAPQGSHWPAGEYTSDKKLCISTPFKVEGSAPLPLYPAVLVPYIDPNPPPPLPKLLTARNLSSAFIISFFAALKREHWLYSYISIQLDNPRAVGKYLGHNARSRSPRNRCLTSARVTNSFVSHCFYTGSETQSRNVTSYRQVVNRPEREAGHSNSF